MKQEDKDNSGQSAIKNLFEKQGPVKNPFADEPGTEKPEGKSGMDFSKSKSRLDEQGTEKPKDKSGMGF
ncbi:MAG: hypothetical protein QNK37_05420 [Acidobacteriota bacterium]|nr:hypothetical protein [Acidobacteriota bacterium]